MDRKFWATTFTLSGTIMGAGILGLPYVFSRSGFLVGVFWVVVLSLIMLYVNLSLAEVTIRTRGKHQLAGLARKYLGKFGQRIMFFAVIFGIYSALLAYLVGEAQSFSSFFPGNISPLFFGFLFWLVMTLLLQKGLKELKTVETYGVLIIVALVLGAFFYFLPRISLSNLVFSDSSFVLFPFGVVLFSLLGFTSIPELREEIRREEKYFRKAIIVGTLLPAFLYLLFTSVFVGILGRDVTEVATLSLGPVMVILGVFTMLTSYFVLNFSLKDTYQYDLKLSKKWVFFLSYIAPLLLYLVVSGFNILGFTSILGIGGVISGGLTAIMILVINLRSKRSRSVFKHPELVMPMNWPLIILFSLIFIAGIIVQFIF